MAIVRNGMLPSLLPRTHPHSTMVQSDDRGICPLPISNSFPFPPPWATPPALTWRTGRILPTTISTAVNPGRNFNVTLRDVFARGPFDRLANGHDPMPTCCPDEPQIHVSNVVLWTTMTRWPSLGSFAKTILSWLACCHSETLRGQLQYICHLSGAVECRLAYSSTKLPLQLQIQQWPKFRCFYSLS